SSVRGLPGLAARDGRNAVGRTDSPAFRTETASAPVSYTTWNALLIASEGVVPLNDEIEDFPEHFAPARNWLGCGLYSRPLPSLCLSYFPRILRGVACQRSGNFIPSPGGLQPA